ncbi:MAG: iron ABC transporter permease [Elusimicrobiota bacterium]|jgi:iron complex transport system permease protein|nr:iron ABC transporter permease [Elusimicrobiota bacterium]
MKIINKNFLLKNINVIIIFLIFVLVVLCLFTRLEGDFFNFNNFYNFFELSPILKQIILESRLPRIILALIVGASLSTSGVVFQGILRNPLAESYTLGISGSVVLFVNLLMIMNQNSKFLFIYTILLGVVFSISIIYSVFIRKKYSISQVLLIGILINIISLSIVEFYSKIYMTKSGLIGSLDGNIDILFYFLSFIVIFAIYFCYKKGDIIDILSLGEVHARFLGINVKLEESILFLLASFIASVSIAYTGIIGFVGLVIPYIVRNFTKQKTKFVIFTSALFGALYLILADFIAKNLFYPIEIPVGIITNFIGGIFFIYFIFQNGVYNYE